MKRGLLFSAVAAYLLSVVFPSTELRWIVSGLSILIVIVLFGSVKRFVKMLGILFLGSGLTMLIVYGEPWQQYVLGFGNMLNILSLFALLPLIALPIELGSYAVRVQAMIRRRVNRSGVLYIITSFLSYILSTFMNMATLPMIYVSISPSLDLFPVREKERFMSRAITHGYSMPIIWTPVASIVGIIVEMTGVRWSSILPILIPFSLLGLLLDWSMGIWVASRRSKEASYSAQVKSTKSLRLQPNESLYRNEKEAQARHPLHIGIAIVAFNLVISLMEIYTRYSFLFLVTVAVVPFSFVWSLLIGKGRQFIASSKTALQANVIKIRDQFFIFLCAGFFISVIQATGAGHAINTWIIYFTSFIGSDSFILIMPLIPLALAYIGLHPAVGLALVAESLNPQMLGISKEITAIALLTGAPAAFLMGPYNATAGIMSSLVNRSPYRVSNWNAPFTVAYLLMVMLLLLILK